MNRILVVSWFFPPVNSSEGLVTYKLLKNSGYEYDVLTQNCCDSWSYGKNDALKECDNIHPINLDTPVLDAFFEKAIEFFTDKMDDYDIVMTRSMPPESHKIGMEMKKMKPSIKWIASFGDPIANNPFSLKYRQDFSPYSLKNRYLRKMSLKEMFSPIRMLKNLKWNYHNKANIKLFKSEQEFETSVLKSCDRIIFNSKQQMHYMTDKYSDEIKSKGVVLCHSFDSEFYPAQREEKHDGKITMSFVGHLDNTRTPRLFLEAVNLLKEEHPDLCDKFKVNFYGHMATDDKMFLLENELFDVITLKKPVNYLKSLEIMKNSDWLLQIDANLHGILKENVFFAAKIADYIGADRPIFAITMFDGAGADVIRDVPSVLTSYTAEEIKNYLYLIVYEGYMPVAAINNREKYNAKTVAAEFDKMVKEF